MHVPHLIVVFSLQNLQSNLSSHVAETWHRAGGTTEKTCPGPGPLALGHCSEPQAPLHLLPNRAYFLGAGAGRDQAQGQLLSRVRGACRLPVGRCALSKRQPEFGIMSCALLAAFASNAGALSTRLIAKSCRGILSESCMQYWTVASGAGSGNWTPPFCAQRSTTAVADAQ